ncbi:MAG: surface-adhesin E family protein [Ginsengibacter sp.]
MKPEFLFILIFTLTSQSFAQKSPEWIFTTTNESGGKIYINPSFVKKSNGIITIEYKEVNKLLDSATNFNYQLIFIVDINCTSKKMKLSGMRMYDVKGKLIMQHLYKDDSWNTVLPNTMQALILKKGCELFTD